MKIEKDRVGHTNLFTSYDKIVDHYSLVALQFNNKLVLESIRKIIPDSVNVNSIPELIEWFQTFMTWNQEPELTELQRFNYVPTLLKTRTGRCGEWAILFTALLNAVNFVARIVVDFEDHVWTEVWMIRRWVHVDCTLEAPRNFDHPFIYKTDFKHKIIQILAFSPFGIEEVTEKYRPPSMIEAHNLGASKA